MEWLLLLFVWLCVCVDCMESECKCKQCDWSHGIMRKRWLLETDLDHFSMRLLFIIIIIYCYMAVLRRAHIRLLIWFFCFLFCLRICIEFEMPFSNAFCRKFLNSIRLLLLQRVTHCNAIDSVLAVICMHHRSTGHKSQTQNEIRSSN